MPPELQHSAASKVARSQFGSSYNWWWANQYGAGRESLLFHRWPQLKQCSAWLVKWPETSFSWVGQRTRCGTQSGKWRLQSGEWKSWNMCTSMLFPAALFQTHLKYMSELKCTLAAGYANFLWDIHSRIIKMQWKHKTRKATRCEIYQLHTRILLLLLLLLLLLPRMGLAKQNAGETL